MEATASLPPLRALSEILWRERELLEELLFRLEVEQLMLVSGKTKRLPHATRDVEEVLERIREIELGRSAEVDAAAQALGLEPGLSLLDLSRSVPAPWDGILLDHRSAFIQLTAEVSDLSVGNRDLLASSRRATQETLMGLRDDVEVYNPAGLRSVPTTGAALLDESF